MKHQTRKPRLTLYIPKEPLYPNGADRRYYVEKAVNILTAIVSSMGFISAMLFLLTLS